MMNLPPTKALMIWAIACSCAIAFAQGHIRMGSSSMAPTLANGEKLEVNVDAYKASLPKRWEIITFQSSAGSSILNYRIVGLPGDTISYNAKKILHVNGIAATLNQTDLNIPTEFKEERVFVESWDGEKHLIQVRDGAPILLHEAIESFAERDKCSYAQQGFSCVVPPNKYFVMGDNRDSSRDSRYRGFVPIERILGRVENVPIFPAGR